VNALLLDDFYRDRLIDSRIAEAASWELP